jgi:transposase
LAGNAEALEDYFGKNPPRSTAEAAEAIERMTGIRRVPTQVREFLGKAGLKSRKLGMIPAKADADERAKLLDEEPWPRLKRARRLKRVVGFADAAHFVHGPLLGDLWCFARLLMRGPSGRERFNALGAFNAVTHELTTVRNETTINAEAIGEMLVKLSARHVGLPIAPVLDDARYQRCAVVRELARALKIELLFLPTYSANLNRIERLWRFVEKEWLSCRYHEDFARFKAAIVDCLDGVEGKHRGAIRSLMRLRFQNFDDPRILAA